MTSFNITQKQMDNLKIIKELKDISWNVTEPEYRADRAISYSTLSTFAREGIKGLRRVLEGVKLDSASLRHGSAVDTLLTDSENFNNFYIVTNYNKPSDLVKSIVDLIWEKSDKTGNNMKNLSPSFLLSCIDEIGYGASNWKAETKINKVVDEGNEYFQLLPLTMTGKQLLHQVDYDYAVKCVDTLKNHKYTSWIFDTSNPNIKIYYQLKFKITFDDFGGINPLAWQDQLLEENTIRCMFDIIVVDYERKIILPIDLKTTSHTEEDFELSIQDWYYDLQATKYSYTLRQVCKHDDYFKDFKVLPFCFLPINKFNLNPQLYEYETSISDIQHTFRDYKGLTHLAWYEYLKKVRWHLEKQEFNFNMSTVINNGKNKVKFT